jgi:hypothetical protein
VTHVWIAGREVVRDRCCLTLDEADILARAHLWRQRLAS